MMKLKNLPLAKGMIIRLTSCLFDYNCFHIYYKLVTIDLSKQLALDANPKAMQKTNITGNLNRSQDVNCNLTLIIEEVKETILDFHKEPWKYSNFILS